MTLMKILIAHCRYQQPGGEDAVVAAEAELLRNRGHTIELYERDNHDIERMGKLELASQSIWSTQTYREVSRALAEFRPDIVHAHNTFPLISPSLYWAVERARIPLVQTLHNFRLLCPQAMLLREEKICEDCVGKIAWRGVVHKCYRDSAAASAVIATMLAAHRGLGSFRSKVTRFIALNRFCRDKFVQGGLPGHKIVIKPNFVDLPAPMDSTRRGGGLYAGRLSSEKGIGTLVRALQQTASNEFIFIGDGPERFGVPPGLAALGWQPPKKIYEHMRRASYLVVPSLWYENFPRTIVEAFACGLPVIASRIGALAELIEERRTGLLFTAGSDSELAKTMAWAESHPAEMAVMGKNARAQYEAHYTPEKNYQQLTEIYSEAIAAVSKQAKYRVASA